MVTSSLPIYRYNLDLLKDDLSRKTLKWLFRPWMHWISPLMRDLTRSILNFRSCRVLFKIIVLHKQAFFLGVKPPSPTERGFLYTPFSVGLLALTFCHKLGDIKQMAQGINNGYTVYDVRFTACCFFLQLFMTLGRIPWTLHL